MDSKPVPEPAIRVLGVESLKKPPIPDGVSRIRYVSGVDGRKDWALVWPPESGDGTWVVAIHGHGSTGDQLFTRLDIRQTRLPVFRRHGFGILTPNLRGNAWMGPSAAADLRALLAAVRSRFPIKRLIFASGSMGASSNLVYAVLHPDDVAACVALCPATDMGSYHAWCRQHNTGVRKAIADAIEAGYGGTPAELPEVYARHSAVANAARLSMPVFLAHGSADPTIPVDQSRRLAAAMARQRSPFRYVEIPDGHHDSPLGLGVEATVRWVLEHL